MGKKMFLLVRLSNGSGTTIKFLIVAATPMSARKIAAEADPNNNPEGWLGTCKYGRNATCSFVGIANNNLSPGVVMREVAE